jgi:glycosyltransferase involved in cell wall biosynthesis
MPLAGDAPRIIKESGAGIACEAGDPRGLADAVLHLKKNREVASHMAQNGRRFALQHYSREACVRKFERVFKHTVGKQQ